MLAVPAPPVACAVPNAAAAIVRSVQPDAPPAAYRQHAGGAVQVIVDLDDAGRLTRAVIASTPSQLLNPPALDAARHTVFRPAIRDCRPIASRYTMTISFEGPRVPAPSADAAVTTVVAEGSASAPPDVAAAHVEFATRAATPAAAIAQNDALAERYRGALRALGIDASAVVGGYYDVLPSSAYAGQAAGGGYFATHELVVDTTVASLQSVFDAAAQSGATAGGVAYDVLDRKQLYDAAVLAAMRDAVLRTDRAVTERQLHRGALLRSQPTFTSSAPVEPVKFSPAPVRPVIPPSHPVELHVRLAVTYALQPD
jgi:TonB family protein